MSSLSFQCIVSALWVLLMLKCSVLYKGLYYYWLFVHVVCGRCPWTSVLVHQLITCKTGKRLEKTREVIVKKAYITNEEGSCWTLSGCYIGFFSFKMCNRFFLCVICCLCEYEVIEWRNIHVLGDPLRPVLRRLMCITKKLKVYRYRKCSVNQSMF